MRGLIPDSHAIPCLHTDPRHTRVVPTDLVCMACMVPRSRQTPSLVRVFFGVGIYFSAYEKLVSLGLPKQQDGSSYVVSATDSARTQQQERGSDTAGRGSRAASGAQNGSMDASRLFLAGAMARVTAATMVLPVTVIKTRLEWGAGANLLPAAAAGAAPGSASRVVYRGGWHALTHIATHEGLRGLYAGLGATIIRDAPFAGIHVVTYTRLKHLLASTRARDTIPQPVQNLVTSASAAVFATLITHPADVVRTRAQMMPKVRGARVSESLRLLRRSVRLTSASPLCVHPLSCASPPTRRQSSGLRCAGDVLEDPRRGGRAILLPRLRTAHREARVVDDARVGSVRGDCAARASAVMNPRTVFASKDLVRAA